MATTTVNMELKLAAKGIKEANTDASNLRGNLEGAQKAAGNIKTAAAARQAPGSAAINTANAAVNAGSIDDKAYGKVRGTVGTGAAGRDFAKQSQGLGGVVQLYATFAANLFAVGAAYEALNKAAAAERLAKATEMMSVQVGVNLKGISNNLVEASGHALSFQDAMQFTNIGTSAGLAGKQIESLTKIARGAASALGRDVNDSVRRIIQGTAKQEQEILDELGIFVKSKQAFDKYSKEIGVKADDLTGRQRTQAYANEVERLGKKWEAFAEIDDPFSKFAATGKNALNDLLTSVNQFIKPVLSMLAESEGSIKAIIILISTMLAKRALPELGGMFNGIFNYDKQLAQKAATDRMKDLNAEAATIKSFVAKNIAEIEKLNAAKLLNRKAMTDILDSSAAKSKGDGTRGYTPGLAMRPLITDLLGGGPGKESIDVKKLSDVEHIESRITRNLNEQVKKHGEVDGYMKSLVSMKLIEEGSTKNNIILGEKAKADALAISKMSSTDLENLLIRTAKTKELDAANKAILDNEKEKSKLIKASPKGTFTDNAANIAANTAEAASLDKLAASESKASTASIVHANSNKLETVSSELSTISINTETVALERNAFVSKAASKGEIKGTTAQVGKDISIASTGSILDIGKLGKASFTGMGEVLAKTGAELSKVTVGMGMYSSAANIGKIASIALSGGLGVLKLGIQGIIGAFSMVLGPLMLAWTAWEMFGGTIKEWLGVDTKAQQALEEQAKKQKEYSEATGLAAMTLQNLNTIKRAGFETSSDYIRSLDLEITVLTEQINRIKILYKEKEDAAKSSTLADLRKAAEAKGEIFNEESMLMREQATSEELSGNKDVANSLRALADVSDTLTKQRIISSKTINQLTAQEADAIYLTKDVADKASIAIRNGHAAIMDSSLKVKQQEAASAESIRNGASLVSKSYEELSDKQKKMRDEESKLTQHAKGLYDGYNKQLIDTNVTAIGFEETLLQVGERALGTGKDAATSAILFNLLSDALSRSKVTGRDGSLMTDVRLLNQELDELKPKLQAAILGVASSMSTPVKPKAIEEYTAAAKAYFTGLKSEIAGTKSEMHILDIETANTSAIDARTTAILGYQSAEAIQREQESANNKAALQEMKALEDARMDYVKIMLSQTKSPEEKAAAVEPLVERTKDASMSRQVAENAARIAAENKTIQSILAQQNIEYEKAKTLTENSNAIQLATLGIDSARLEVLKNSGIYTEAEVVAMSGALQQRTAEITLAQQVNALEAERANKLKALQIEFLTTSMTYETYKQAEGQLNSSLDARSAQMQGLAEIARTILGITLEQEAAQARQNDRLKEMAGIAESLTRAFGELGTSMAGAMEAIRNSNDLAVKNSEQLLAAEKELADAKTTTSVIKKHRPDDTKLIDEYAKKEIAAQDKVDKLKKKSEKDELSSIARTAGATKKMFAEKTAAYKILDGVEKAASMMKLAMDAKEMASDIMKFGERIALEMGFLTTKETAVGASIALSAAETSAEVALVPAKLGAAASTMGAQSGWAAFAGIAALVALVSALSGGSVSASVPGGITAEDMQQSQGTGQSWVDGKLVDNGGGVFGDPTAKSESIQNSLDLLNDNQIDGLSFASEQTRLLEKINQGIEGVAIAAYGIEGIRTGSGFGTIESSTSSPGLLGLFASSKSTEIINAGIKMTGTFKSLGVAGDGLIQQFETVKSTSTNSGIFGLFSSSKTSIKDNVKPLETKAETAIREVFGYMGELLVDSGDRLGLTAVDALNRINGLTVDITASLQGLTGKETQEELNAIFSSILDDAYTELAPHLTKFKKFGEGMAQTVTRVIDGFDKVNKSFNLMGLGSIKLTETMGTASQELYDTQAAALAELTEAKAAVPEYKTTVLYDEGISITNNQKEVTTATEKVTAATLKYTNATDAINDVIQNTTTRGYELSEALIDAAGGLDKFIESAQLFSDRFLTEAERAAVAGEGMFTKLNSLGASNKKLKEVGVTVGPSDPYEETNGFAMKMFQTFSDGNDSVIDTTEEYKNLVQGVQAIAIAEGTSAEDRADAVALFAELTESNLMEAFANIADAYAEAFDSPMDTLLKSKNGLLKEFNTLGQIGINASQPIGLLDRQMKAVGISSINSKDSFTKLMNSLTGTDAETVRLRNGLMALGPAFASIADEVSSLVTEVSDSVSSSIKSMRMDTLDEAGKYAMIDSEGADSKAAMLAAESIYDISEAANATIESLNSAWSLLTEDQKKNQLNWYTNELKSIDDYVKDKGADAISIRQAENEELATSIATASADTLAPVVTTLESVAGSLDTIASTLTGTSPTAATSTIATTSPTTTTRPGFFGIAAPTILDSTDSGLLGIVGSLTKTLEDANISSIEQSKLLIAELNNIVGKDSTLVQDTILTEAIISLNNNVTKQIDADLATKDTNKDSVTASMELLSIGFLDQSNLSAEISNLSTGLLNTITTLSDKDINTALTDAVVALNANISTNSNNIPEQEVLEAISSRKQQEQKQLSDMLAITLKSSLEAIGINLSNAAGNMKAAADKPVQVAVTLNVTKTPGTEVGLG